MNESAVPAPEQLPLELLLRLARREVQDDDGATPQPALVALQRRATRDVFDRAAALAADRDVTQRGLGVQILRELGDEQPDGHRPFRDETVALMRARLREETAPSVLGWIVSALGHHRGREALSQVVALAGHPDDRVRFHVAAALTGLVDLDRVEPEAAQALFRLCHDEDAEIRYYALYAATREIQGLTVQAVTRLTAQLTDDSDEQIRTMAAAHHAAIGEVREFLTAALPPGDHDHLIGPILVTLACAGESADAGQWLDEELRRHLAPGDTAALAKHLVTWWTETENRRWAQESGREVS